MRSRASDQGQRLQEIDHRMVRHVHPTGQPVSQLMIRLNNKFKGDSKWPASCTAAGSWIQQS